MWSTIIPFAIKKHVDKFFGYVVVVVWVAS